MGHKTNEENLRNILRSLLQSSEEDSKLIKAMMEALKRMEEKLDQILAPTRALMLPNHLRPTMMVVQQLGEVTARQVSEKTKRTRATMSNYLNQLVRMGYLKKWKVGKVAYFSPALETPVT